MVAIAPEDVRYIKLGVGGKWARSCIAQGELHFGYAMVPHELCASGQWKAVADVLMRDTGRDRRNATDGVREIRDFYGLGSDCLWITFFDRHLWWCFAEPEVIWLGHDKTKAPRVRRTISGWRNTSIKGEPLKFDELSSCLTQVASYRQTICRVSAQKYLLNRINGIEQPIISRAKLAHDAMISVAADMIEALHWADFEVLVDLVFARSGWHRISRLGGSQKDTDLVLQQPVTGETAFVQVKSKATQAVLDGYVERFRSSGVHDRMFFAHHNPSRLLDVPADEAIQVLAGPRLASMAIDAGLLDWLTERVA